MKSHPDLWLYLLELELPISLVTVGIVLGFYKVTKSRIPWFWAFVAAIVLTSILTVHSWFTLGRYIPNQTARLYEIPISSIKCIRIRPGQLKSLIKHDVVITNVTQIRDIMLSIRSAEPYFPNHPETHWRCLLVISNASGDSYVDVADTDTPGPASQGTILDCEIAPEGDIYDTLRSDTLGEILEKDVGQKK